MAPVAVVNFGAISIHALHEESDLGGQRLSES